MLKNIHSHTHMNLSRPLFSCHLHSVNQMFSDLSFHHLIRWLTCGATSKCPDLIGALSSGAITPHRNRSHPPTIITLAVSVFL